MSTPSSISSRKPEPANSELNLTTDPCSDPCSDPLSDSPTNGEGKRPKLPFMFPKIPANKKYLIYDLCDQNGTVIETRLAGETEFGIHDVAICDLYPSLIRFYNINLTNLEAPKSDKSQMKHDQFEFT